MAGTAIVLLVAALWTWWDSRRQRGRPVDPEREAREDARDRRFALTVLGVLAVTALALVLQALGVRAAGWVGFGGVFALAAVRLAWHLRG